MWELFIKWLVPFVCGGIVSLFGVVISRVKIGRKKQDAIELGLQALLRAEIIRQFEKYDERQYCPLYAKEALKREYDSYHALGGNDIVTGLYQKTMSLPNEPPEEKDGKEEKSSEKESHH